MDIAAAVFRCSEADVYLAAAVIGVLPLREMVPGEHDPPVMLHQAFIHHRGGVRIPGVPEGAPARIAFAAAGFLPGRQFVGRGYVRQVPVDFHFVRFYQGKVGLNNLMQHVGPWFFGFGKRAELLPQGPEDRRSRCAQIVGCYLAVGCFLAVGGPIKQLHGQTVPFGYQGQVDETAERVVMKGIDPELREIGRHRLVEFG